MSWIRSAGSGYGQWNYRTRGLAGLHSEAYPEIRESINQLGFPGGSDGKVSACNVGDSGLIPGLGRSPGEGNGNPLQYFCLENPMDGGAWWATVHGVAKCRTWLSDFTSSHQPVSKRVRALGVVGGQWFQSVFPSIPAPNKYTHSQSTLIAAEARKHTASEYTGSWLLRPEKLFPDLDFSALSYAICLLSKGPTALTWGQTEHPEFPKKLLGGWHGLWLYPFVVVLNNCYLFTYLLLSVLGPHKRFLCGLFPSWGKCGLPASVGGRASHCPACSRGMRTRGWLAQ